MARKAMVTRTFITTRVSYMAVDKEKGELLPDCNITLAGSFIDNDTKELNAKALLKALDKAVALTDPNLKVVKYNSYEQFETLYGMDEQKFLANAEILPPRKTNE